MKHSLNTKIIIAYLSYLRDISRKIISRHGFEKCLLNKSLGNAVQIGNLGLIIKPIHEYYNQLKIYNDFLLSNLDKKLFIGFGAFIGNKNKQFAAPLITIQCELLFDETDQVIYIEPNLETLNINYDFLSASSTNLFNEEDYILNSTAQIENRVIEEIEVKLSGVTQFDSEFLNMFANNAFISLQNEIERFKDINQIPLSSYNLKNEITKHSYKSPKNRSPKLEIDRSIFEKDLVFVNSNHLFLSYIPDELSTFEALNSFVENITEQNDFKNPVVEKLLINALTDERAQIKRFPIEDEVQEIIDKYLPISLSSCQIKGLKNAWTNEISYIQGPPGTGKSHTISAIVLSAIAMGKKVLVLSQKTAALKVVNTKIEPYLTNGDGFLGVCYYDNAGRKNLRKYCSFLRDQTNNTLTYNKVSELASAQLDVNKISLNIKLKDLRLEQEKLDRALQKQRFFKEINSQFLFELNRINLNFFKIPKGFKFKRIKNLELYDIALARIEKIWELNSTSIVSKLFVYKFKEHLKKKFETPLEWLVDKTFPYFAKSFIKLNILFTELQNKNQELNIDAESLRKIIENLKIDILILQKLLIKTQYNYNVLINLYDPINQIEIDKFNGMLSNVNSRIIDKKMKDIDFIKITDVIPFWTAEIRNLGHLFPLQPDLFDLIIVDEASQVNLAEILPAFYRGKKLCIVGDHNQLSLKAAGLNFSLSKSFDELTWERYNRFYMRYPIATKNKLTVTQASILDFIKSDDYNVPLTEIMLDEHFRSLPRLAKYTSKQFYRDYDNPDGKLKIMTETPEKLSIECFQSVLVKGTRDDELRTKHIIVEAEEVIHIIECLINFEDSSDLNSKKYQLPKHINSNNFTIGVISMIRDQCECIKNLIRERFPNSELKKFGIDPDENEGIGTPEEFQGNERDIMIFSLCLDTNCKRGQGHFQDPKRLNVATSRAKYFTYFVYSPFDRSFSDIYNYLHYINGKVIDVDLKPLPIQNIRPALPPLNHEAFESDFERYVYLFLNEFVMSNLNEHNITIHNQIQSCGQKRLDFVLYNHDTAKSIAIEVDGSHHFVNNGKPDNYTFEHIERLDILKRAGWNIINTPYHKWYKNGWLSEESDTLFKEEINRIFSEIRVAIF